MTRKYVVMAMVLVCVGCRRTPKRKPAPNPATRAQQELLTKIDVYVRCLEHSERVFQIGDAHLQRNIPVYATEDPKACVDDVEAVKELPPAMPEVEAAAERYAGLLRDIHSLTKLGEERPGPAVSAKLTTTFREFDAAQAVLFDQVFRLNHQALEQQVAAQKHRTLGGLAEQLVLRAGDLAPFGATPWTHIQSLDVVAMTAALRKYEAALEAFTAHALSNPDEISAMKGYYAVSTNAKTFMLAARQLMLRVRDKLPFSDAEKLMIAAHNERAVFGTPAAMIEAYNRIVETYGTL